MDVMLRKIEKILPIIIAFIFLVITVFYILPSGLMQLPYGYTYAQQGEVMILNVKPKKHLAEYNPGEYVPIEVTLQATNVPREGYTGVCFYLEVGIIPESVARRWFAVSQGIAVKRLSESDQCCPGNWNIHMDFVCIPYSTKGTVEFRVMLPLRGMRDKCDPTTVFGSYPDNYYIYASVVIPGKELKDTSKPSYCYPNAILLTYEVQGPYYHTGVAGYVPPSEEKEEEKKEAIPPITIPRSVVVMALGFILLILYLIIRRK